MLQLLFYVFIETCLVMQESVVLFECGVFNSMAFWSQMLYYGGF